MSATQHNITRINIKMVLKFLTFFKKTVYILFCVKSYVIICLVTGEGFLDLFYFSLAQCRHSSQSLYERLVVQKNYTI